MVLVRDLVIGKNYIVNGVSKKLLKKEEKGAGGSGDQEPYFLLQFDNDTQIIKDWDVDYTEIENGGKRKYRLNRKTLKKSRKNHKKSNRRR